MTFKGMVIMLSSLWLLSACSATPPRTDYALDVNFLTLKTFAIESTNKPENELADERVKHTITEHLINSGFNYDEHNPDFLVRYQTKEKLELTSANVSLGLGTSTPIGAGNARLGTHINAPVTPKQVEMQLIDIRIYNAANRLIWRGSDDFRISKKAQKNSQHTEKTTLKILNEFPPRDKSL